ncbi:MAG: YihY/virulence factor BrkB family protein [bacterium]|nr:YihY/virulence factor BrkB family protein [bacterium]
MRARIQQLFEALERGRRFVTHDVWHIGRPGEQVPHGFIIKQVRVVILLVRSLIEDTLLLRAAALTFTTMLSAVPLLVLMFLIMDSLDLSEEMPKFVENVVMKSVGGEADPDPDGTGGVVPVEPSVGEPGGTPEEPGADVAGEVEQIFKWLTMDVAQQDQNGELENPVKWLIRSAAETARPETLGIVGMVFVLTTALGLIWNIESSFNAIWGLRVTRSWYRMFSDYMMVLILLPILVGGVLSVSIVLARPEVQSRLFLPPFFLSGLRYVVIWTAFTALYYVVPNTRVKFRYAILGGIIAGTLWILLSISYVKFQIGLSRYNLIYSSFALVPLFLMWMYFSWMVMLFGAELTFAYQNERTFAMERLAAGASHAYREALGLHAMIEMAYRFDTGLPALTASQSAEEWCVPTRLMNDTLTTLEEYGLVRSCATEPITYQPARSVDKIAVRHIVNALRESGRDPSLLRDSESLRPILEQVGGAPGGFMDTPLSVLIQDMRPALPAAELEDPPPALPSDDGTSLPSA